MWRERVTVSFPFTFFWVCAFCPSNSLAAQNDKSSIEKWKTLHANITLFAGWKDRVERCLELRNYAAWSGIGIVLSTGHYTKKETLVCSKNLQSRMEERRQNRCWSELWSLSMRYRKQTCNVMSMFERIALNDLHAHWKREAGGHSKVDLNEVDCRRVCRNGSR